MTRSRYRSSNSPYYKPAVDIDRLPGDVAAALRGEEDRHRHDVERLLPAPQRHDATDLLGGPLLVGLSLLRCLLPIPRLPHGPVQRRLHHARTERIDAHSVGGQVPGGTLHEIDEGRLRGTVRRIGLRADL